MLLLLTAIETRIHTIDSAQNGLLNIYNFIIAVGASLLCDKIGRRPMFLVSTAGTSQLSSLRANTLCYGRLIV